MTYRFLTPTIHGLLDYAAALALIVLPGLLGLGDVAPLAAGLSIGAGIGLIGYSLITDYRFGAYHLISFRVHLFLDLFAAVAFALAPIFFGWSGLVKAYYLVMSAGVFAVVLLTSGEEAMAYIRDGASDSANID